MQAFEDNDHKRQGGELYNPEHNRPASSGSGAPLIPVIRQSMANQIPLHTIDSETESLEDSLADLYVRKDIPISEQIYSYQDPDRLLYDLGE